jgi:hypothetical protein
MTGDAAGNVGHLRSRALGGKQAITFDALFKEVSRRGPNVGLA